MANDNICSKVIILLKTPDGGISRIQGLPSDPEHNKGNFEIVNDIINKGIEGTDWEFSSIATGSRVGSFSLKYVGE